LESKLLTNKDLKSYEKWFAKAVEPSRAERHNDGKPKIGLISYAFVRFAAYITQWAADSGEYKLHDWRKGMPWSEVLDSLLRHATAIADGEWIDPSSRKPHLWHVAWNCMAFCHYVEVDKGENDLWEEPDG
jgi:hypothetical protein